MGQVERLRGRAEFITDLGSVGIENPKAMVRSYEGSDTTREFRMMGCYLRVEVDGKAGIRTLSGEIGYIKYRWTVEKT